MKNRVLTALFGVIMIAAGVVHFVKPGIYTPFFGSSWIGPPIVLGSGIIEITVGAATLAPATRRWGTFGILVLMVCYLPLHVLDAFAEHPVIGSHAIALIRLPMQLVLIAWAFAIQRGSRRAASAQS